MFEDKTYDKILNDMLDNITIDIDKREGSVIYTALAPAAMELTQAYKELNNVINLVFADTSSGEYLERLTTQFGITRNVATKSIRKGMFYNASNVLMDVNIGTRFGLDGIIYIVTEKISTGIFKMQCETAGIIGNTQFGNLLAIDYVQGLVTATLSDVLIKGEDEETDAELRDRFFEHVSQPAFGGNIADYLAKTKALEGVGAAKIIPTWDGGGTVKIIILDSDYNFATTTLVNAVQAAMGSNGSGLSPIGHDVTVVSATKVNITVSASLSLEDGYTISNLQNDIEEAIEDYFTSLKETWEENSSLIVRIAQLESRILSVEGIIDITNTQLNSDTANIIISNDEIPFLSTCTFSEVS